MTFSFVGLGALPAGAIVPVSNLEASRPFYEETLASQGTRSRAVTG